jgi:hypothetical protein
MREKARHLTHPTVTKPIGPVLCGAESPTTALFLREFMKQTKDLAQVTCKRCLAAARKRTGPRPQGGPSIDHTHNPERREPS